MALVIDRRRFIKCSLLGALGLCLASKEAHGLPEKARNVDDIPVRILGKTGLKVTILSAPGWHISRMKEEKNGIRMLRMAKDYGINFYDSAWKYENGASEVRIGKAFKEDRHTVHLMTKVVARDKKGALEQLHDSLTRMNTDYIDLWQFHEVDNDEEVEKIFGPDGACEAAVKAKQEGKIRHIGFTGHRDPKVLLRAAKEYDDIIETLQMPINVIDPHYLSFIKTVIPEAVKRNIGVIAMKTCSIGLIIEYKIADIDECLNFAWSQSVSTVVSGMDHYDHLKHNVELAKQFKPMTEEEQIKLLSRTKGECGPDYERYKIGTTKKWRRFPENPLL